MRGHFNPRGRIDFINGDGTTGTEIGQEIRWANDADEIEGAAIKVVSESGGTAAAKLVFKTSNTAGAAVDRWQYNKTGAHQPVTDITYNIGSAGLRVKDTNALNLKVGTGNVLWTSGSGTPEGAVTAAIGALFTRTDGGASTTLYVKESGAGNTGWIAK